MCGRFNVIDSPGLQQLLRDLGIDLELPGGVNIAPTERISLLRKGQAGARVDAARWWLTPSWAPAVEQKYAMFNARSETLAKSRAYSLPFKRQRGLVPMSSFIEWRQEEGVRQPWLISNEQGAFAIAALWDVWEGQQPSLLSCTLVTTAAADSLLPWHTRMPVILAANEWDRWLDNNQVVASGDSLFRSELKMPLRLQPLSRAVNNAREKAPEHLCGTGELIHLAA